MKIVFGSSGSSSRIYFKKVIFVWKVRGFFFFYYFRLVLFNIVVGSRRYI